MNDDARPGPAHGVLDRLITLWALFGGLLLAGIVVVNLWAVIGGLLGLPIAGDFELTEMGTAVAVFTFLPYCQLTRQNVTAEIFAARATPRTIAWLSAIGSALALVFGAVLLWRMSAGLLDQRSFGYATTILQIPIWWAFVPILVSLGMLCLAAIATLRDDMAGAR